MHVPCPVPLSQPWSPAGYQVVPLAGEPLPPPPRREKPAPRSPIGYRVVVVADEKVPVRPREDKPRGLRRRHPRSSSLAIWLPIAAIGALVLVPVVALSGLMLSRPQAQGQVPANAVAQVQVPAELLEAKAPAAPQPEQPALAPEEPRPGDGAPPVAAARENFGTAVQFARNAQEAVRLAKEQGKLTMFLHVSGNFENDKFT